MYAIELVTLKSHIPLTEVSGIRGCSCGWTLEQYGGSWSAFVAHLPVICDEIKLPELTVSDNEFLHRCKIIRP